MLICVDCGEVYSESEVSGYYDRDYADGVCVREDYIQEDCSSCGGELIKAVKCEKCGEWIVPTPEGVCSECLKEIPLE